MLNTILTYIIAIAMTFGAAGFPAVPETVNQLAIENVVIRVDDETFPLDTRAVLSAAAGTEESLLGFYLENKGSKLFPLQAKITAEDAMFSISEFGSAFRITDADLLEMIGLTEADLPEVYDAGELQQMGMGNIPLEDYTAYGDIIWEFFLSYEGAEVSEGSISYEGSDYPCTTVYTEDGIHALWALLDSLRLGDHGELSAYLDELLGYYREEMGIQGESYAEMFGQISELPPAALKYSRADVNGDALDRVSLSIKEDDTTMEVVSTTCRNLESVEMNMTIEEGNYTDCVQLKMDTVNRLTEGDMSINGEVVISEEMEFIGSASQREVMEINYTYNENGNETAFTSDLTASVYLGYDGEMYDPTNINSISFDALATRSENSIHVNANLMTDLQDAEIDAGIDFDITFSEVPYADPFAGKTAVDFSTPEELTESGQFKADGMSFAMDAMRLSFSQDASRLMDAAELLTAPKTVDDDEYAEAAAVFGAELPKFDLPEGWFMKDVDAAGGSAKLYFVSEDGEAEFRVSAACHDGTGERIEYMVLGEDGKLTPAGGGEDLTLSSSIIDGHGSVVHGNVMLNFVFYDVDEAFMHEILDGIEWTE